MNGRYHLDFSDGRRSYMACELGESCERQHATFTWREGMLLRIADYFDRRAQWLLREKDNELWAEENG